MQTNKDHDFLDIDIPYRRSGVPRAARVSKKRFTVHLPEELIEECRDCVVALSGPPHRLTLSAMVGKALRRELKRLKKEENGGRAFPCRESELRGGRPVGS